MEDAAVDAYIDFCRKALLPLEPRSERKLHPLKQLSRSIRSLMTITADLVYRQPNSDAAPSLLSEYFPLAPASSSSDDDDDPQPPQSPPAQKFTATQVHEDTPALAPGQAYAIYSTQDALGSLPAELDAVMARAAAWAGVEGEYVCGVVERYERRLGRWWAGVGRREREKEKDRDLEA